MRLKKSFKQINPKLIHKINQLIDLGYSKEAIVEEFERKINLKLTSTPIEKTTTVINIKVIRQLVDNYMANILEPRQTKVDADGKIWTTQFKNVINNQEEITTEKICDFLIERPQTSDFIKGILLNIHLSDIQLAKKFKKSVKTIKHFRTFAIKSVLTTQSNVKPTTNKTTTTYKSNGKEIIKDTLVKLLLDDVSPKAGIIPTLPFEFDFEKRLVQLPQLKELYFNGYEGAYNIGEINESKARFLKQLEILKTNTKLRNRMLMRYGNINDALTFGGENQFAHIFADYCGLFKTNQEAMKYILTKNIVQKNGLVWFTISTRGEKNVEKVYLPKFFKQYASNYKIEQIEGQDIYKYVGSASGIGAPMLVIILRRIK